MIYKKSIMDYGQIIGIVASISGSVSLIPEVIKAIQNRSLKDVAWGMLFLLFSCSSLWCLYAVLTHDIPLTVSASVNMSMQITLIFLKKKYDYYEKPLFVLREKKLQTSSENTMVNTKPLLEID